MPHDLISLAYNEGIALEYWDFEPPLEGVYWKHPELPPVIGLSKTLFDNPKHLRTVLGEELGHHFTTVGNRVPVEHYCYADRVTLGKAEYKALSWAARHLVPFDSLLYVLRRGISEPWELAEVFDVDESLVQFRLRLVQNSNRESRALRRLSFPCEEGQLWAFA